MEICGSAGAGKELILVNYQRVAENPSLRYRRGIEMLADIVLTGCRASRGEALTISASPRHT